MKKWYAISIIAINQWDGKAKSYLAFTNARSRAEAKGVAYIRAEEDFPKSKGWDFSIMAIECPDKEDDE